MEIELREALLDWLRDDPALSGELNLVAEEAPASASLPWLGIASSASADWSTKTCDGREVRVALELHCRSDSAVQIAALARAVEGRIASLPPDQPGFTLITSQFLRARSEQRPHNVRAMLIEYRFRLLAD